MIRLAPIAPLRWFGFAVATMAMAGVLAGCSPSEPSTVGAAAATRELTETQYHNIIANIFGPEIKVPSGLDPIPRSDGLIAVGASKAAITPSAFERYDKLARLIASQVVGPDNRAVLIPCAPTSDTAADAACAAKFFGKVGPLLYRRPLSAAEIQRQVALANDITTARNSFYDGLAASLAGMLVAPDFLLISDSATASPSDSGRPHLDDYAIASRLSFFLWNAGPDEILLAAAEKGELDSKRGLAHQVDRMLDSPRLEAGVRAFFSDMLGFDGIETLQKDPTIYPAFIASVANDAKEQTLRTIADLLLTHDGDYRDLFTTRKTFVTKALGLLYRVPVESADAWVPVEFPQGDPRVGIQAEISLLALSSHPGRSSVTLRGKAVRELLLCQKVPDPPANVDFTLVSDSANPVYKTARQRVSAHSKDPSCAGCHKLMDPIGLSLENFDGAGQFRTAENGVPIDASGELDGLKFSNSAELGHAIHDNPALPACVVNRLLSYATGHAAGPSERPLLAYFEKRFAEDGYRLKPLLRAIATSDGFYAVAAPATATSRADGETSTTKGAGL